ncbi:HPr family phosphocarrier protein [Isoptericola sp. S6320L]|uniref:HPr family phosphocarrier protein n=1 Tax=Isoptericola sp. S6320L TaxID=2926411 RepID=UPI001FF1A086|nr:HPr family phosphocarrier protein [Isoptericola sp. S6320L]MCK0118196.1 HPr family phosphocarrier protein [Isoptericola sp. S6320L]
MERHAVVAIPEGLHARPAAQFARLAAAQPVPVRISRDGNPPVDAASILAIMTLGADAGSDVTLQVDVPDDAAEAELDRARDALDALEEFLTDPGR